MSKKLDLAKFVNPKLSKKSLVAGDSKVNQIRIKNFWNMLFRSTVK